MRFLGCALKEVGVQTVAIGVNDICYEAWDDRLISRQCRLYRFLDSASFSVRKNDRLRQELGIT